VYCVDAADGEENWRFALDRSNDRSPIYCAPLVSPDGDLYIAGMEGQVYCLDAISGQLKWKLRPSEKSEIDSDLATDGKRLFFTTRPDGNDLGETAIFAIGPKELIQSSPVAQSSVKTAPPDASASDNRPATTNNIAATIPLTVIGRVVDGEGNAIEGAMIYLPLFRSWLPNMKEIGAEATSDAEGHFRLSLSVPKTWPEGRYERGPLLWAYAANHALIIERVDTKKLQQEKQLTVNLTLPVQEGHYFGVQDPDGKSVRGARIAPWHFRESKSEHASFTILPFTVQEWLSQSTDADGNATIPGIKREDVSSIRVEAPTYGIQHINVGDNRPVTMRLARVGRLVGRVIADDPAAVRGKTVVVEFSPESYPGFAAVITNDEGLFVVPELAEGEGRIRCEFDSQLPFRLREERQRVRIRANETTSIEIFLDRVASDGTASPANNTQTAPEPVEIAIIVAKHVLLHDGKIIEWADLEKLISALPNPKLAHPVFKFTSGGAAEKQEEIRAKIWDFRRRVTIHGHTWASVSPDESARYDTMRPSDVLPREGPTFRALILNSETNEPVAGIRLFKSHLPGQPRIEGVSDENGLLMIENMTPGEVEFDISAVGENQHELAGQYARWWSPDALHDHERQLENDNSGIQRNFDSLTFNVLGNTVPIRIFVEKDVSIRGRVIDPDGEPVAGATVAPALTGSGNSITGDTRYSVRTAADGTFHIRLPASKYSEYNLVAHDGGYQEWRNFANGVGAVLATWPGQELTGIELQLTRPGVVRGKVVDGDGRPVAKHRVRAQAADKFENRYYDPESRTDENGQFELKFVRPGDHFVQADPFWLVDNEAESEASRRITVKPGEIVDGIELIHRPVESRPPIDHILPDVPIPSSRLRR
jgi:protocatechuate 3,4-dioxygenase beta subunit